MPYHAPRWALGPSKDTWAEALVPTVWTVPLTTSSPPLPVAWIWTDPSDPSRSSVDSCGTNTPAPHIWYGLPRAFHVVMPGGSVPHTGVPVAAFACQWEPNASASAAAARLRPTTRQARPAVATMCSPRSGINLTP